MHVGLLIALVSVVWSQVAFAWDDFGHRLVASSAYSKLDPAVRNQVDDLLGGGLKKFMEASVWADRIKAERPDTRPWDYVNIPLQADGYDHYRDCPSDNCIVEKLRQFVDELKSHTASRDEKTDALRFVVHFVADIHQPLHCANRNDRGGNDVPLVWEGRRTNLHEIWDHYAVNLASIPDVTAGGNVVDWCNESHELARKSVYEGLPNNDAPLPQTYMDAATTITKGQLARAASRLATVLNESMR